jgi:hypothetical protein
MKIMRRRHKIPRRKIFQNSIEEKGEILYISRPEQRIRRFELNLERNNHAGKSRCGNLYRL